MRKKIVAGNWKMNTNLQEGVALACEVNKALKDATPKCDVVIAVPFTHLATVNEVIDKSKLGLGAENCASEYNLSEILSRQMEKSILDLLLNYLVVGAVLAFCKHFSDTEDRSQIVFKGESHFFLKSLRSLTIVLTTLRVSEYHISGTGRSYHLAYEPVWAIGTGKTATDDQAEDMHAFIRGVIAERYGKEVAEDTSILYGGSCKPPYREATLSKSLLSSLMYRIEFRAKLVKI